jgi:hypothetical protein
MRPALGSLTGHTLGHEDDTALLHVDAVAVQQKATRQLRHALVLS